MKVTIDSSEPLTDTIRVIGALYNVTLTQAEESARGRDHDQSPTRSHGPTTRSHGSARSNGKPGPSARKQPQRSPAHKSTRTPATATRRPSVAKAADPGDIRAWAQANGHTVNDRGPLPGTVKAAYAAAHNDPPQP